MTRLLIGTCHLIVGIYHLFVAMTLFGPAGPEPDSSSFCRWVLSVASIGNSGGWNVGEDLYVRPSGHAEAVRGPGGTGPSINPCFIRVYLWLIKINKERELCST